MVTVNAIKIFDYFTSTFLKWGCHRSQFVAHPSSCIHSGLCRPSRMSPCPDFRNRTGQVHGRKRQASVRPKMIPQIFTHHQSYPSKLGASEILDKKCAESPPNHLTSSPKMDPELNKNRFFRVILGGRHFDKCPSNTTSEN
jgi:hypothetical protein